MMPALWSAIVPPLVFLPNPLRPLILPAQADVARASRTGGDPATGLAPASPGGDHGRVDLTMTLAVSLIGLAAIAAGVMGMRLPPGERLAAGLPLVIGAGVGVIALAIGSNFAESGEHDAQAYENVFLVASALGFVATIAGLALLRRWTSRDHPVS
jgi:hypothetical protein